VRVRQDRPPVAVAFSGGKDSTAALLLLRGQGHEVSALTMRLGLPGEEEKLGRIESLARVLGAPWEVVDLRAAFREKVLDQFLHAYRSGRTPNPCVECNRCLKFGLLLAGMERRFPGGLLATGHYADKVRRGRGWFLREPRDRVKSQVYFLAAIDPAVLGRVLFPLAGMTVAEVRSQVAGLPLANARESQDVCFLQGEDLGGYLARHVPGGFHPGDLLDTGGATIGRHDGALHFTIGQRRGTGHAAGRRLYVVGRDLAGNTVTLGDEKDLYAAALAVKRPVFWRKMRPDETLRVKVRYEAAGHEAVISEASATIIRARFREPVRAVTPGQLAVFYDGDVVVAAGEIAEA
jgi:tRNA (5-methylaminomethyl-2-thiouridylate)-methyltransferase